MSNPYNTYISTEDNAETQVSNDGDTELSEDREDEDADAATGSSSDERSDNIGRWIFLVLVIIISTSMILKNKEKILEILKSFWG